jgi:hypothetical protein
MYYELWYEYNISLDFHNLKVAAMESEAVAMALTVDTRNFGSRLQKQKAEVAAMAS